MGVQVFLGLVCVGRCGGQREGLPDVSAAYQGCRYVRARTGREDRVTVTRMWV